MPNQNNKSIEGEKSKCCGEPKAVFPPDYNGNQDVCSRCVKPFVPLDHLRGEESEQAATMECAKCHRTSVVVPLRDKCPFCTPSIPNEDWEKKYRQKLNEQFYYSNSNFCVGCGITLEGLDFLLSQAKQQERDALREKIERMRVPKYGGEYDERHEWANKAQKETLDALLDYLK